MTPPSSASSGCTSAAPREGRQLLALQAQILSSPLLFASDTDQAWCFLTEKISHALYADRVSVWLFTATDLLQCIDLFDYQTKAHCSGAQLRRSHYPKAFQA